MSLLRSSARLSIAAVWCLALAASARWSAAEDRFDLEKVRAAVTKAIPLLETGARGSLEKRAHCFTCHNQGYPLIALRTARDHGFAIDRDEFQKQVAHVASFLAKNKDKFLEGKGTGGEVATAGTALWALEIGDWPADETTAAVAEYLLQFERDGNHWAMTSDRPPSEHSHFTANYLAIRGLQRYATEKQNARRDTRLQLAKQWLLDHPAQDTEDHVFRLWALVAVGASSNDIEAARKKLLELQRDDGGWGQKPEMPADAYATSTVMMALHEAAGVPTDDAVYRRGVAFLLRTQLDDGSWHVVSRSKPFQTYFESGFPHGKDQFISITASAWAVTALALACPLPAAP